MTGYLTLAALLLVQNFAFVVVSRARNSQSISYHALASVFSNGLWFASQFLLIGNVTDLITKANWTGAVGLGGLYILLTTTGAVVSHWVCMRYLEKNRHDLT